MHSFLKKTLSLSLALSLLAGAAGATVIAQYASGIGIMVYALIKCPQLRVLCSRAPKPSSATGRAACFSRAWRR